MFERWALVIVSLGKSFLWSRKKKKWTMCCIRKLLEAFCVGCKLMVDQFKIKGVKVMENKTQLVQSPWEEGKQPVAPNPDSFLDFSSSYLPYITCRSCFSQTLVPQKSCMCVFVFFFFFCLWYLDVTHGRERPEKPFYCCNNLFLSGIQKRKLSFVNSGKQNSQISVL